MGCHALQGIFPTQGWNPGLESAALAGRFFTTSATWETTDQIKLSLILFCSCFLLFFFFFVLSPFNFFDSSCYQTVEDFHYHAEKWELMCPGWRKSGEVVSCWPAAIFVISHVCCNRLRVSSTLLQNTLNKINTTLKDGCPVYFMIFHVQGPHTYLCPASTPIQVPENRFFSLYSSLYTPLFSLPHLLYHKRNMLCNTNI